ncbi:hypothetical protein NDK43_26925 [Neobacillus pocheonensis]|uniref:Uncharacterized protein n=1 Tax=Neobacillus pocheonensis TaxID=363869 RepID=A0ABT0WIE7_9BACI|nr:hypothetical protein [Neobacillus pocheonensis]
MSKTLARTVPMNVIIPVDKMTFSGMPVREDKPYKTLYLLHGVLGNYTDWVSGTNIVRWAMERDLVIVMPSGDNTFYVDNPWTVNNNFGGNGNHFIRLNYACPKERLEDGLQRLKKGIEAFQGINDYRFSHQPK